MKDIPFVKLYERSLRDHFDLPALSNYGSDECYTYGEVAEEIKKLHILFEEYGVKTGDHIALVGKNNARWCIAYLATVTYGAVTVPILNDFNPHDIHHIINHSDSTILFASDSIWDTLKENEFDLLRASFSLTDFSLKWQKDDRIEPLTGKVLRKKLKEIYPEGLKPTDIRFADIPNSALTVLNYTSGTSGFSKGVMITGENLCGNLVYAHETIRLHKGEKLLSFLPLAHTYGSAFEFLFPFMEGCHITLLNKTPSPQVLLKAFAEVKPVLIISVPLILEKIYWKMILPILNKPAISFCLKIPGLNSIIYSSIRKKLVTAFGGNFSQIVIGGAGLNNEVETFLLRIKFPVTVGYGMTECAPLVSFSTAAKYVPHSCGKVLDSMKIRIDSEDPYSVAGEIQLKGRNVMAGYYKSEEATREAFTEDGWLKTGDLGTIDRENNVFIRGRLKDMILGGSGQNIYPEEIEAKLNNLPYVSESLVVERNGKLVALVFPDYEASDIAGRRREEMAAIMEENRRILNRMVANYEKITEIELFPEEFEKTPKKSIKRFLYT